MTFNVVAFDRGIDRSLFSCGKPILDKYFAQHLRQDVDRDIARGFLMMDGEHVAGYFTLSATSVQLEDIPVPRRKNLPRYSTIPAAIIGRLAVDTRYHGRGVGGELLINALEHIVTSPLAAWVVIVDALDGQAAAFYRHYGFEAFQDTDAHRLYLPVATARKLFS
jgi:predicted N-acetyltransferase YhbS